MATAAAKRLFKIVILQNKISVVSFNSPRFLFQLTDVKSSNISVLSAKKTTKKSIHHRSIHEKKSNIENAANNLFSNFNFSKTGKTLFYLQTGQEITYGDFGRSINRYAIQLRKNFNVKKGDRVTAQVNKSPESIALYLATIRIGAVYVPLNIDYKKEEVRYFLSNAEPSIFVCRRADLETYRSEITNDRATSAQCVLISEEELAKISISNDQSITDESIPIEKVCQDDLAAICYTSGTTGKPKGAMITHGNLASNAKTLCDIWRITDQDILLHAMPIYHIHGLFVAINSILTMGASMVFLPRFEIDSILEALPQCNLMMGVPTFYNRLLHSDKFTRELVSHIRLFVSGSAPLLESTWREFKERTGKEILERYGMTEGQMISSNPYDGLRKPGTVGRPLPGVDIRIEKSTLQYKGPNLFKGYWRMPEKTKEDFTEDGYFISGDLAEFDTDGYLRILGRGKDLIISGGLNVYPKEIENAIDALSDVVESAVIAAPHPDFGEAVVAVVVTRVNQGRDREIAMIKELKDRIAAFKVPKRIFFQKQLPRNVMGKVQKNVLREMYQDTFTK